MIGAQTSPPLPKPIGYLDIIGHSHAADGGASMPDFGASHKVDGFLEPAIFRSAAKGGANCSYHDQGNGANGDGGWATVAVEFHRQEPIAGFYATTLTGGPYAAGVTSLSIAAAPANSGGAGYAVIGQGSTTEVVRVGLNGTTLTVYGAVAGGPTATQFAHSAGDPVYWSMDNDGYLPKSQLVICNYGANDLAVLGPTAIGTTGTTAGASRGLVPLQHAYRFCMAVMRCCVIYKDTHPSCRYGANWTSTSYGLNVAPAISYPGMFSFTSQNTSYGSSGPMYGNYHKTTVAGSTVTFSTEPNFPGGTVDMFFFCDNTGGGALWDVSVAGATTRTVGGAIDTRSVNAIQKYSLGAAPLQYYTGCVYRLTGLSPGVNTITLTANTINVSANFMGWGIESPQPPLIFSQLDPRPVSYSIWQGGPYQTRQPYNSAGFSTQTATVAAGAGTAAGSVTLGTAVTIGTTTTNSQAVYPGDTITIGSGADQETRVVQAVDSTTTLHVDANFVNAHTGDSCVIGLQDADYTGGGSLALGSPNDAQGQLSVPGLWAALKSVVSEFDSWVQIVNTDDVILKQQKYFTGDLVHYNDAGHSVVAASLMKALSRKAYTFDQLAQATVPNSRSWTPVYGDYNLGAGGGTSFLNQWSNYYHASGDGPNYPRTGFYKDMRSRQVTVRCYVYGQNATQPNQIIFQLPPGYRPASNQVFVGEGAAGMTAFEIDTNGNVYATSNGNTNFMGFTGSFLAEQ